MVLSVRSLTIHSPRDAERQLASLGVDPFTVRNLGPKFVYRVIQVNGVDRREFDELKQALSSVGGDAAMCKDTRGEQESVAVLMGTVKQLRKLAINLSHHPLGFAALATEILRLLDLEIDPSHSWNTGKRVLDFSRRLSIMGILNVTPDSFSDGNRFLDVDRAVDRALQMEAEGADIIDIGGESTRPFAPPVSESEEMRRVIPVLERLHGRLSVPVSIDTYKSTVARVALATGAEIINDISGLTFDDRMAETVAEAGAGVVLMHTRGRPTEMQKNTAYLSVIDDVIRWLVEAVERAERAGIARDRMVVDPGIGFGKSIEGNVQILSRLSEFTALGKPILIGTSRKGFIGKILGREADDRVFGTAATVALAVAHGASVFRVHDVKEMRDVVDMAFALTEGLMESR